ncbi:MAG TPA: SusD/RagB family nutrient-binding outer membrane lipoprotein [Puia sp.]
MKSAQKILTGVCVFLTITVIVSSCKKFSELNSNPNSITPDEASADYLMSGVLTQTAKWYGNLGSGIISGAMQQTAQDAFQSTFSDYQWDGGVMDWTQNYYTLNNNKLLLQKAQGYGWNFHEGVALVMRAFNFGCIADYWGSAPDSMALNGDQAGLQNQLPAFESQDSMYMRVIADLKAAIPMFAGSMSEHAEITSVTQASDVYYGGDPVKWQKFAYTLLLRYYLRLSAKMDVQSAVEAVADKVFQDNSDDCAMAFPGVDQGTSYQFCTAFNQPSGFQRNKMSGTLTMRMRDLKDPRIVIMAQPISTPSRVDASKFAPGDNTTLTVGPLPADSIRYINPAAAAASKWKQFDPATYSTDRPNGASTNSIWSLYDTSSVYVGIPISYTNYTDFLYNINGVGTQSSSLSNYVSYLRRDIYDQPNGSLLNQKLASYAEVCFDLAEAAQRGWSVPGGNDAAWYYAGIQASFDNWQVFNTYQSDVNAYYGCVKDYSSYIAQPLVAYNGTLARIMEQKWIAGWQTCNESYMDWRRTGLPALNIGYFSYRAAIPLRFVYNNAELSSNSANAQIAINQLEPSAFVGPDGKNSAWSKFWLLQGTGEPW